MAYEVTASRKRPPNFDQLAGQDFVATSLQKSVASGRIAHAYLFSGPRGVGKTSAARILAKAINCENWSAEPRAEQALASESPPPYNPCGTCDNCLSITRGNSLDVIEIDGASNTSVNDVREIRDEVLFAPTNSRYKVYIIDEVHMLSNSAFNALLKTIEEPPPYIVFIFATTEVHKVPATIKSRCQQFNFRLIGLEDIKSKLREISAESNIEAEDEALLWIAKEATGSLRDAYTLYDQIAAFSDGKITIDKIKEKLGLVGLDEINELVENFADGSSVESLRIAGGIIKKGISPEQFVIELSEYFRNLLFIKNGIRKEEILGSPAERFSAKALEKLSVKQIEYALSLLLDLFRNIRYSLNQQFEIELAISRLSFITKHLSDVEILENIKKIKDEIKRIPVHGDAGVSGAKDAGAAADANAEAEKQADFTSYRDEIVANFKKSNIMLASSLAKTTLWTREGNSVKICCIDSFSLDFIKNEISALKKELDLLAAGNYKIELILPSKEEPKEDILSSNAQVDLIKTIFKGDVSEVRIKKENSDEY
ncbi:MAG: DNA polymerase III subunit gamma/tau [Spirochaetes bacterium]|nr:DNA polymerase III subunit gamma/tau [Spirochaetota bacterium]